MPQTQSEQDTPSPREPGPDMSGESDGRQHPGRDVMVGLFFLAWACVGWIAIAGNAQLFIDVGLDPGPSLLPIIVLAVLSLGGLAILATGLHNMTRMPAEHGSRPAGRSLARRLRPHLVPAVLILTMVAYPSAMHALGYTTATAVFVLGWILALTAWRRLADARTRLISAAGAALATAVVVAILYAGFVVVIHAPLP